MVAERLSGAVIIAADALQRVKICVDLLQIYKILRGPAVELQMVGSCHKNAPFMGEKPPDVIGRACALHI